MKKLLFLGFGIEFLDVIIENAFLNLIVQDNGLKKSFFTNTKN